jgi:hypothetical protein
MADNPKDRGPQDQARVNMDQDYEVRWWSKKFKVTPDRLRSAVDEVGPSSKMVARQLGKEDPY